MMAARPTIYETEKSRTEGVEGYVNCTRVGTDLIDREPQQRFMNGLNTFISDVICHLHTMAHFY